MSQFAVGNTVRGLAGNALHERHATVVEDLGQETYIVEWVDACSDVYETPWWPCTDPTNHPKGRAIIAGGILELVP